MPKVSVIVPVYNVEKYIKKCMESLVNQTLDEIQIIVVNDGSEDESEKIIKEYIEKYPSKILYLKKENGGLSDARNFGIPYATGEYIAFLDSDDYVELNTYKDMYELAKSKQCDYVECDFLWEFPNKVVSDIGEDYSGKHEMLEKVRVVAWNKLIKKEVIDRSGVLFPKGYRYEDVEFTYKIIPYIEKTAFLRKQCIHYTQRENSISNVQNERTKEIFSVLENVITYYKEKEIYDEFYQELEYTYTRILLCSSLLRICKIKNQLTRNELIDLTWEKLNYNFPSWKKNVILNEKRNKKNIYMKSINKTTYKIYTKIFRRF